jgi:hypothetical protein
MLVASITSPQHAQMAMPRRCLWPWASLLGAGLGALLLALLLLAPHLGSSMEMVRLRNALMLAPGAALAPSAFDWRADELPADFAQEQGPVNTLYRHLARQLHLDALGSDWERVRVISQHLLSNPKLLGTPIQLRLDDTYWRILQDGTGYCGDFTRVFMALALAGGMEVRAWSFSLDGFGGHGHIWPEVWNRELQRWQLLDVFNNVYFARADGVPLSALDLHQALAAAEPGLRLLPLAPRARPGYSEEAKAWDYYRSGLSGWYMAWGNAVFGYDQALLVRSLEPLSHALTQLGGIAQGQVARIHILADAHNAPQVVALQQLRERLLVSAALALVALAAIAGAAVGLMLQWRRGVTTPAVPGRAGP